MRFAHQGRVGVSRKLGMGPPSKRAGSDGQEGDLALPLDAQYEILLRLPAKELCRLRTVCRPWRSLFSDPRFIAAHSARHPGPPLIVAEYRPLDCDDCVDSSEDEHVDNFSFLFDIMDLSGRAIKRFPKIGGWRSNESVRCDQLDVVCITKGIRESCVLLNPATGSVFALPEGYAEEHSVQARGSCHFYHLVSIGQVASTGQYKVLRLISRLSHHKPLCEVFTFDTSSHERWRGKKPAPGHVYSRNWCNVVIKGIAYFLLCEDAMDDPGIIRIASFDLGTEDWRTTLRGPDIDDNLINYDDCLSVASLNDSLVVNHCIEYYGLTMDLWFLVDIEKGLWVKQHSIRHHMQFQLQEFHVQPLLVLNDERILTYIGTRGLLRIYNPRTSTFTDVADIGPRGEVSLYTGSPLCLASAAS